MLLLAAVTLTHTTQAPEQQLVTVAGQPVSATAITVPGPATLTPCQRCCAPGGDCSTAYKGQPGKCCGVLNGQAFCCPGMAGGPGGAKCYSCADSYRCYTGFAARNICGGAMPVPRQQSMRRLPPPHYYGEHSSESGMTQFLLLVAIAGVIFILCCRRERTYGYHEGAMMAGGGQMAPVGVPVGGYPVGVGGCGYPVGGYSGMSVAGGAATGFLGGMLVSDMMHSASSHHHGGDYGGYASGGDYGGGGYGGGYGGGDMGGGGDCGFSSDS